MTPKIATGLGLLRDFAASVIGLGLLFGVIDAHEAAGILLVVTTGAAFGVWAYQARKGELPPPPNP